MALLRRKSVLLAKIETTPGTAESLAGTDGVFNVYDALVQASIEMVGREGQGGFGRLPSIAGAHRGTATFRTMWEWDGTATEPAWMDTFFPACGWVKATNTFTPRSEAPGSNVKTLTIGAYVDGVFKSLAGCVGNFVINLQAGQPVSIDWTFEGVWQGVSDTALPTPTYPTDTCLRWAGGVGEWNDVNLFASTATVNSNNTIYIREHPNTEAGLLAGIITDRAPSVTVNPEAKTVATQDRWAAWLASTQYALELDMGGPGNSVASIDAPKAQIINQQQGDREGLVTDEIEFLCGKNGATHDQEFSIVMTPAT